MNSAKLGKLVNWLGIHHQYQQDGSSIGCHNAGNDAAYTMMALLIYAVRWESLVPGKIFPMSPGELENRHALHSVAKRRTLEQNEALSFGKVIMHKARSLWNAA